MENGGVVIDRWTIRMAATADTAVAGEQRRVASRPSYYLREVGGELAKAIWNDGRVWNASLGTLRGQVLRAGMPATNAPAIRLSDTDYEATPDSAGRFEIGELLPGPYDVAVVHPELSAIFVDLETGVRVMAGRDSVSSTAFEQPTAANYVAKICGSRPALDRSLFVGRVVDLNLLPMLGATFVIEPADPNVSGRALRGTTGSDGLIHRCGIPRGTAIRVSAERDTLVSGSMFGRSNNELIVLLVPVGVRR
jgi:hypothetical protein